MKQYRRSVVGVAPLLMNNPTSMKPVAAAGGKLGKSIPTPDEEAKGKVYRLPDGALCIPASWIIGALQIAAKSRKIGRFAARAVVSGSVFTTQEFYPLLDPETAAPIHDYVVDARRAVIQRKGVIRGRPKIPRWQVDIELEYDDDLIQAPVIDELLNIAGRVAGFGDYAPHDNGPFGRFALVDWLPPAQPEEQPKSKKKETDAAA